uniref:F-ATPase gamma subunit n=1 Tax=Plectus sambesii TaxID=2011161 RepID=A0A914UV13_9BILA
MWRSGTIKLVVLPMQSAGPQRNMATLKDISLRLKSVTNIQKITKSMKMVSAAKYAKAERELKAARPYGEGAQNFYKAIEGDSTQEAKDHPKEGNPKRLLVLLTSDRGLCGAVHTSISKEAKAQIAANPPGVDLKVITIGDKSKAMLQRLHSQYILLSGNEIGRQPPTFKDASLIAQGILDCGFEFDEGQIIFNKFRTVVSYTTSKMPIMTADKVAKKEKMTIYDSIDDD